MSDEEFDPALSVPEISDADLKYVDKQLGGKKSFLTTWVVKVNRKGKPDQRVMVISEHFLFIIKKAALGRKVRIKVHWYDLDEIQYQPPHHVLLVFGEESVELKANNADDIIDAVREAYAPITLGFPDEFLYDYRAPDSAFAAEVSVGFSPAGNFAVTYEAWCAYLKMPVLQPILDSIRAAVTYGTNVVDLTSILNTGKDPPSKEILSAILPLFRALRFNTWCEKIALDGTQFVVPKRLGPLIPMLADTLEHNSTIETIDIRGIESSAWAEVAEELGDSDDHAVGGFVLPSNQLGDKIMTAFAAVISKMETPLTAINFANNACTPKGMCALLEACASAVAHLKPVAEINVSDNRLEESGSRALADMLRVLAATDAESASTPIDPASGPDASNLYDRLTSRVRLVTLSLQNTKADVRVLVSAMRELPSLESVNLSGNEIAFDAVQELVQFCASSQRLKVLGLSSCGLDGDTVQSILQALISNVSLPRLRIDISNNNLSFYGAQKIADTIRAATNVHTLNISSNALTSEGIGVIVDAVISVSSLQALSLSNNLRAGTDAEEGAGHLARLLTAPTNIRVLQICGSRGGEMGDAIQTVFKALARNRSLWHLDISDNEMGDEGMEALCKALAKNASLQTLVWDGNDVGLDGWELFLSTLNEHPGMLMEVEEPKEDIKKLSKKGGALVGRGRILVQDVLSITQRTRSKYSDRSDRIPGDWPVDPVSLRFYFDYLKTLKSGADAEDPMASATGPGGAAMAVGPGGAAMSGAGPSGGGMVGGGMVGGMVGGGMVGGMVGGGPGGGTPGPGGIVGPGGLVVGGAPNGGGPGGGMVGGGMVGGGMVSGGMVSGGMVSGGMVSGGMVSGGMVSGGMVSGGMVSGGMVSGGMVAPSGGAYMSSYGGGQSYQSDGAMMSGMPTYGDATTYGGSTSFMPSQQGMGMPQQGMGMPQQGMGMPQQGMGMPQQGMGMPQQGMGMPQQGIPQQMQYSSVNAGSPMYPQHQ
ncbi:leucine rich repeat containing 16 [Thecamonas trahens ATCC 50062]|uniref:Leucine rich repeat containing 16 n=1 Tax=Thecamonas trahens ATCC 50062 TaxID=461836 RepID=A0A0L0DU18_THETB|nr:leucine rich repeat containing 16 [Thecamonas trahens ATCC 50062]KNC55750.1 leucine rich repeat containing 16 [Thecamonas trahens ATCC 50062]|eukprot:XP_013752903.1 leucine rich repeat containing 16 [Thecamonas trahens ATCC 50062]